MFKNQTCHTKFQIRKKDQTTNYRKNTTLPILAKSFEKLAHNKMICIINRYNLQNTNQFGFLARQNTADAPTEFSDKAYDAINQNIVLLAIFLVFLKPSIQLIMKLFRGKILHWLRSFLSNRSQFFEFDKQRPSSLNVKIGVPRGSMLGPILLVLYISGLNKTLTMLKSIHFADETTLYLDKNPSNVHTSWINSELGQVQTWINENNLSLNGEKTIYMSISNRNQVENINISLSGQPIAKASNHKFLVVFVGNKL